MYAAVAGRRRPAFSSVEEARAHFSTRPPLNSLAAEVLAVYAEEGFRRHSLGGDITIKCDPKTEAAIYGAESGSGVVWSLLEPLRCPVTLLRGSQSDVWSGAAATGVAERLNADLLEVPEAGHFGPLESPDKFARLLRTLIA
jgi:pimeloyl-ACP methyl ester carboxylesterase